MTAPSNATPTAPPMVRKNWLAEVATPNWALGTAFCIAISSGVNDKPNPAPTTGTATTGPQGYANIPFTNKGEGEYTLSAYVNQDGTPGQGPGDLSAADLEFKAGEANLVFADADDNAAAAHLLLPELVAGLLALGGAFRDGLVRNAAFLTQQYSRKSETMCV